MIPEWEPVARERGGPLPGPVSRLLALWREARAWSDLEVVRTCAALEQTGYRMRWITRQLPASAPSWAHLLAPLMQ